MREWLSTFLSIQVSYLGEGESSPAKSYNYITLAVEITFTVGKSKVYLSKAAEGSFVDAGVSLFGCLFLFIHDSTMKVKPSGGAVILLTVHLFKSHILS